MFLQMLHLLRQILIFPNFIFKEELILEDKDSDLSLDLKLSSLPPTQSPPTSPQETLHNPPKNQPT